MPEHRNSKEYCRLL